MYLHRLVSVIYVCVIYKVLEQHCKSTILQFLKKKIKNGEAFELKVYFENYGRRKKNERPKLVNIWSVNGRFGKDS